MGRHFGMPGGLFDYGIAEIMKFFDNFEEADKYAKEYFKNNHEGKVDPVIWVLRCDKSYHRATEGLCAVISKEK